MKIKLLCLILSFALLSMPAAASEELFEKNETRSARAGKEMTWWVYAPAEITENTMLVVFLHGGGEMGGGALDAVLPASILNGTLTDVPAVVAVPQMPKGVGAWLKLDDAVIGMTDEIILRFGLDPMNTALCGFSMGGIGTLDIANSHPGRFSKVLVAAGRVNEQVRAGSFAGSEIRFCIGRSDRDISPETVYSFIRKLEWAEVPVSLEYSDTDHLGTEKAVFTDREILDWLFFPPETAVE